MEIPYCRATGGSCNGHQLTGTYPLIKKVTLSPGVLYEGKAPDNEFIFVLNGILQISSDRSGECTVSEGQLLLLPSTDYYKVWTGISAIFHILRPGSQIELCQIPRSLISGGFSDSDLTMLEAQPPITQYFRSFNEMPPVLFQCPRFVSLKIQELFLLFNAYYPQNILEDFLRPLFDERTEFVQFIWKNYRNIKTVNEFAALYNCSVSYFDKKFQQAFGIPTYKWMMQRRNEMLRREIMTTVKPFSLIAREMGFLSNSQFTDYCKKHLGKAPTRLRKDY